MGRLFSSISSRFFDLTDAARDLLANLFADLKESNRYLRIKMGLIAGYGLICVGTVVVFVPAGELNEIDARVLISRTEIVGGRYVLVVNEGSDTWKQLVLAFNGHYTARHPALRPGGKKTFFFSEFMDPLGRPPPEELRLEKLRIDCSEGAFERDFGEAR